LRSAGQRESVLGPKTGTRSLFELAAQERSCGISPRGAFRDAERALIAADAAVVDRQLEAVDGGFSSSKTLRFAGMCRLVPEDVRQAFGGEDALDPFHHMLGIGCSDLGAGAVVEISEPNLQ